MKSLLFAALLFTAGAAFAGEAIPWRVHYTLRGSGKDVTILAQNSAEARRALMDMFPGATVTGARRAR
jgi:hypothetical protein